MFISDTPMGINDMQIDDVLNVFDDVKNDALPSKRVRLNYIKMLYDVLGYDLSPDVALASWVEAPATLVISTAGGGKTTWSQIQAIAQKLLRKSKSNPNKKITGDKILCLVYNNHNVQDMKNKHAQMVNKLMAAGIEGLNIDTEINASTMHSFCDFCRKLFVAKLGLVGFSLLSEEVDADRLMQRAIKVAGKLTGYQDADKISAHKVCSLYTLSKETLSKIEDMHNTEEYRDLGLDDDFLNLLFERYEIIKKSSRKYEFVDMLYRIYDLLSHDEDSLRTVQSYFDYIIADEVQDFTPLMWEILRLLVSDGTPLTCIGDEDQNIYSFRGASIDDVLKFRERFPGGKVFTLSENRRCRATILNEAKRVINGNTLRFNKEIYGNKSGGDIRLVPYATIEGEAENVVREIKKMDVDEQNKTVICYKNSASSLLISERLAEEDIPVKCIRAYKPYSHELYVHLLGVFNALEMPFDRRAYLCLWKVLPCKKAEFFEALGYNPETNSFKAGNDKVHFAKINYGKLLNYRGFADAMQTLYVLSENIDHAPMNQIFPVVYKMLCLYFWNYKRSINENDEIDSLFERRVDKIFNVDKRYKEVFTNIQRVRGLSRDPSKTASGVALSTFHSLKGLEFNNVYAIDMDNNEFPNFPLIEYKGYPAEIEKGLKEAETRLWYVAITRAKNNLIIYYNEDNPSKYVLDYWDSMSQHQEVQNNREEDFLLDEVEEQYDDFDDVLTFDDDDDVVKTSSEEITEEFVEDTVEGQSVMMLDAFSTADINNVADSKIKYVSNSSNALSQLINSL